VPKVSKVRKSAPSEASKSDPDSFNVPKRTIGLEGREEKEEPVTSTSSMQVLSETKEWKDGGILRNTHYVSRFTFYASRTVSLHND